MKVLLIKSAYRRLHNKGVTPPLGIMYLASYLREKEKGVKLKIIDTRVEKVDIGKAVSEFCPDVVGISAITVESPKMHQIAEEVKKVSEKIPVIVGGPHPTSYPEEVMEDKNIDYLVIREGEKTFVNLLRTLAEGKKPDGVKGIYFRENGSIKFTGEPEFIENLDELPFPAWDLVKPELYFNSYRFTPIGFRTRYVSIITSRACPYQCIYCHNIFGKKFRMRSPENVIEEIEELKRRFEVNEVEIVDDIFNLYEDRVISIFEGIIRRNINLKFSFPNGLRSDRLSDETLEIMRKGGTIYISFAIESGSPRIQKLIKKNLNLEKARRAIEKSVKLGIFSNGFFMLGFPGETEEDMKMTVDFAISSPLHSAMFFVVIPHRGTELYSMAKDTLPEEDIEKYDYFRRWKYMKNSSFKRIYTNAYIKFYTNPSRLIRIWKDYPYSRKELFERVFYTLVKFI